MSRSLRKQYADQTRKTLIVKARALFSEKNYNSVSLDDIAEQAGMTKGAVYHHFRHGKPELFEAVVEAVEANLALRLVEAATSATTPWEQLQTGCQTYLRFCVEPEIQQVLLKDAPSVLGWAKWREIDRRHGFGLIVMALTLAAQSGQVKPLDPESAAHLLLAVLLEAALVIGNAKDPHAARLEMEKSVALCLDGLKN